MLSFLLSLPLLSFPSDPSKKMQSMTERTCMGKGAVME